MENYQKGGRVEKSDSAFRTISEVASDLDIPQHVLRFWEGRFAQIKPIKRAGGRRYYRPEDVALLRRIRDLLYGEGYTIKGVQRLLRDNNARKNNGGGHVPPQGAPLIVEEESSESLENRSKTDSIFYESTMETNPLASDISIIEEETSPSLIIETDFQFEVDLSNIKRTQNSEVIDNSPQEKDNIDYTMIDQDRLSYLSLIANKAMKHENTTTISEELLSRENEDLSNIEGDISIISMTEEDSKDVSVGMEMTVKVEKEVLREILAELKSLRRLLGKT